MTQTTRNQQLYSNSTWTRPKLLPRFCGDRLVALQPLHMSPSLIDRILHCTWPTKKIQIVNKQLIIMINCNYLHKQTKINLPNICLCTFVSFSGFCQKLSSWRDRFYSFPSLGTLLSIPEINFKEKKELKTLLLISGVLKLISSI